MKVAVDLEEVLSDSLKACCESTDHLDMSDFQSWDLDDETWQVFSGVSDALWRHDAQSIEPMEDDLSEKMEAIYQSCDELDILTHRRHVDQNIKIWLDYHEIPRDKIISTDRPKWEFDYDVYIDDNPTMHGKCFLLLRDHPHNHSLDTESSKMTQRIHSLAEVPAFLPTSKNDMSNSV